MRKKLTFTVLSVMFLGLVLLVPASATDLSRYNLSASQYQMLLISSEIPVIVIWALAFLSYIYLRQYALTISDSPESQGFLGLARGCQWLAWGLPLSAAITVVLAWVASQHPAALASTVIISNYIEVLFPILAFTTMSDSSRQLTKHYAAGNLLVTKHRPIGQLILVVLGIAYSYFLLHNLHVASLGSAANQYFLPIWLLILSLLVPYLYAWFLGLLTAFDIVALASQTPGIIYRRALQRLSGGLVAVIISLMAVQYLRSRLPDEQPSALDNLLWGYLIYAVCIIGFALMLSGIRQMKRIEEV